jgi:uncharacterized RDD family membrane protein YckC
MTNNAQSYQLAWFKLPGSANPAFATFWKTWDEHRCTPHAYVAEQLAPYLPETEDTVEHSATATATAAPAAPCTECGHAFPMDNMIRYQSVYICRTCKPLFMQKLAEGAAINTGEFRYAGFWIRLGAQMLDGLLLLLVYFGFLIFVIAQTPGQIVGLEERTTSMIVVAQVLSLLIGLTYETFFLGRYGATLGKMACGIRVVSPEGGNIPYLRAFVRYFAKNFLNALTIYIGYIIAAFDEQKRGLHDRICNTRVVYK